MFENEKITRRDFLVNFPAGITGSIDLYNQITIPFGTLDAVIFTWTVPRSVELGVLKQFGFGYISGDVNSISFRLTVNGTTYPQVFNTTYPGNIVVPVYALDTMHVEIKNGDTVVMTASNTSAVIPATVWGRTKGWYY